MPETNKSHEITATDATVIESSPTVEMASETILAPEDESAPESPERIAETKSALDALVEQAKEFARPFNRDIERVEHIFDPNAVDPENGMMGAVVEKRIKVITSDEQLKTIQLRTFPDPNSDAAYHLSVSFLPDADGLPGGSAIMFSIESPADLGFRFGLNDATRSGLDVQGRRIQDYLYSNGTDKIPVRQADFSLGYNYRPVGAETAYEAKSGEMDVLLGILAEANVMSGNEKGPKTKDLVPALGKLAETI